MITLIKAMTLCWGHGGLCAVLWTPPASLCLGSSVCTLPLATKGSGSEIPAELTPSFHSGILIPSCPFLPLWLLFIYSTYHLTHLWLCPLFFPNTIYILIGEKGAYFSMLYPQQLDQRWHITGAQHVFIEWMNYEWINEWMGTKWMNMS